MKFFVPPVRPYGNVSGAALVWSRESRLRLTLIAKVTLNLKQHGLSTLGPALPLQGTEQRSKAGFVIPSDFAPMIPQPEVIVDGHAYGAGGASAQSVRILIARDRTAILQKILHVYGDRGGPREAPQPFSRMPITYARAAGGADSDNPEGHDPRAPTFAPNVVDPTSPWAPVGFGALPSDAPSRRRLSPSGAPRISGGQTEIPSDLSFQFYQAAPPDQRVAMLEGHEWILLDGLHPDHAHFRTQLPRLALTAQLINERSSGPKTLAMVSGRLRLEPDRNEGTWTFYGHIAVTAEELVGATLSLGVVDTDSPIDELTSAPGDSVDDPMTHEPGPMTVAVPRDFAGAALPFAQRRGAPAEAPPLLDRPSAIDLGSTLGMTGVLAPEVLAFAQSALPFSGGPSAQRSPPAFGALPFRPTEEPREEPDGPPTSVTYVEASPQAAPLPFQAAPADKSSGRDGRMDGLPFANNPGVPGRVPAPPMPVGPSMPVAPTAPFPPSMPGPVAPMRAATAPAPVLPPPVPVAVIPAGSAVPLPAPVGVIRAPAVPPVTVAPPETVASPELASPELASAGNVAAPIGMCASDPRPIAATKEVRIDGVEALVRTERGEALASVEPAPVERRAGPSLPPPGRAAIVRELMDAVAKGESFIGRDLAQQDLSELDLRGAILSQSNFTGANLTGTRLDRARLSSARFSSANLSRASLVEADLTGAELGRAILTDANLEKATLIDCKLGLAQLEGANLMRAEADRAQFAGAQLRELRAEGAGFVNADFTGASMFKANFTGARLTQARLTDVKAEEATFVKAALDSSTWVGATLSGADLDSASALRTKWDNASLAGAKFKHSQLKGSTFIRVRMEGAQFEGADLTQCDLSNSVADGASFQSATLEEADLRLSKLAGADFRAANLKGTNAQKIIAPKINFASADLSGASFRGARMKQGEFAGAILSGTDFRDADLERADLGDCDTESAKWGGANVRQTKLDKKAER